MDPPRTSRLADVRNDRLARAALQVGLAHAHGRTRLTLEEVQQRAMDLGVSPEETARALERLRERGELTQNAEGWAPRVRAHDAIRTHAREVAARGFWGWR